MPEDTARMESLEGQLAAFSVIIDALLKTVIGGESTRGSADSLIEDFSVFLNEAGRRVEASETLMIRHHYSVAFLKTLRETIKKIGQKPPGP